MKFSTDYNFENIKFVVEGTPIEIGKISGTVSTESSVQELATSASFIKDVIGEIKSTIKEAQTSSKPETVQVVTPPTAAPITEPQKTETFWDLPAIWSVMMAKLPEGFEKAGVGCYTYKKDEATETNIRKTTIRLLFKDESIDMIIRSGDAQAYFYLYGNAERSWFNGINPALIDELINELPDDVKEFVRNFVKKVLNK